MAAAEPTTVALIGIALARVIRRGVPLKRDGSRVRSWQKEKQAIRANFANLVVPARQAGKKM